MGIPAYLFLHPELATRHQVPCIEYQTRLIGNGCRFAVDIDGTLFEHQYRYEPTGREHPPFFAPVEVGDRRLRLHGDLRVYGESGHDSIDLVVRFADGRVAFIKPWREHPEELRQILSAA